LEWGWGGEEANKGEPGPRNQERLTEDMHLSDAARSQVTVERMEPEGYAKGGAVAGGMGA
jgi:hypothetical protein